MARPLLHKTSQSFGTRDFAAERLSQCFSSRAAAHSSDPLTGLGVLGRFIHFYRGQTDSQASELQWRVTEAPLLPRRSS
jgi:hypothetical protein